MKTNYFGEYRRKKGVKRDRYTITYRVAETTRVMSWIRAGQSGCLIGLRGAGKSNFLRSLLHEDVRRHYLGQDYADFVFVFIDLLALVECTDCAVYELMLDRLLGQLSLLGIEEGTVEEMASLHRDVMRSRHPLTGRWAIERCVGAICQRSGQRVVLLLDEFDAVFRTLGPSLFRCLRALRNAHKGQVSYIVVVTSDLAALRDDLTDVEHFYRLVSRNVCDLGPYGEADAQRMIHYLASRRSVELSEGDQVRQVKLNGEHAGLLRTRPQMLYNREPGRLSG
jgi:hypothetical protein